MLRDLVFTKSYKLTARDGEAIFLFLFLLLLPFQTRLVLFAPHPFDEWHAGFLYASDIAFCGLFVAAVLSLFSSKAKINFSLFDKKIIATLAAFFFWAVASATANGFHDFSVYHLVKLAEGIFLFFYFFFRSPIKARIRADSYTDFRGYDISESPRIDQRASASLGLWKFVGWILVGDALLQSVIAAAQFFFQHSLGLWFFRESPLAIGQQDVAQIVVHGVRMIRAYGTFPSPNVLAAFLAVSLFFLYALVLSRDEVIWPQKLPHAVFAAVQFVILAGIFLSFSRAILILFFIVSLTVFIAQYARAGNKQEKDSWRDFVLIWLAEVLVLTALLFPELTGRFVGVGLAHEAALSERFLFNILALQSIRLHPFFGVGIGNFVSWFQAALPGLNSSLYQPVHNILLLIAAEMGVPALLFFIGFLAVLIVQAARILVQTCKCWYLFLCAGALFMFLVGMEDHLFWTIQQTALLFWVVLGMVGGYGRPA